MADITRLFKRTSFGTDCIIIVTAGLLMKSARHEAKAEAEAEARYPRYKKFI